MRKIGLFVALVAAFALMLGALVPAGAGLSGTTMIVKKVVSGTGAAGSTVEVECGVPLASDSATLTFDATGAPLTTDNNSWVKANGGWTLTDDFGNSRSTCDFTETVTGGATTTSWTCAYTTTNEAPSAVGCDDTSGTGTGPATVTYAFTGDEVGSQTSTVTFTNTFPATTTTTTTTVPAASPDNRQLHRLTSAGPFLARSLRTFTATAMTSALNPFSGVVRSRR